VQKTFTLQVSYQLWTTGILPTVDYGVVGYDNLSRRLVDRLEAVQRQADLTCTRAFNRTSSANLLRGVESRR